MTDQILITYYLCNIWEIFLSVRILNFIKMKVTLVLLISLTFLCSSSIIIFLHFREGFGI